LQLLEGLNFPIFSCPLSAKSHKYETKRELSVVIVAFVENTDFMRVSEVKISKMGKLKLEGEDKIRI